MSFESFVFAPVFIIGCGRLPQRSGFTCELSFVRARSHWQSQVRPRRFGSAGRSSPSLNAMAPPVLFVAALVQYFPSAYARLRRA